MQLLKVLGFLFLLATSVTPSYSQVTVKAKELKLLPGTWEGSLTYLDYTSGKPFSMPALVRIQRIPKTESFGRAHSFPKEMEANWTDTLRITEKGRRIEGEQVVSKRRLPNGDLEIVTQGKGVDGNDSRPAMFRHTYVVGKASFSLRKDVQFVGEENWIMRHTYSYSRQEPATQPSTNSK